MVVNQRCNKEVLQNQYTKKSKLIVVKDQESKTVVKNSTNPSKCGYNNQIPMP